MQLHFNLCLRSATFDNVDVNVCIYFKCVRQFNSIMQFDVYNLNKSCNAVAFGVKCSELERFRCRTLTVFNWFLNQCELTNVCFDSLDSSCQSKRSHICVDEVTRTPRKPKKPRKHPSPTPT